MTRVVPMPKYTLKEKRGFACQATCHMVKVKKIIHGVSFKSANSYLCIKFKLCLNIMSKHDYKIYIYIYIYQS
jgi:hypothetical protein